MRVTKKLVLKIEELFARGLSKGIGSRDGQMCVEAAICSAMGLPHGDNPPCVGPAVRTFKIHLNDSVWSSAEARATGMKAIGIAQLGSDTLNQEEFSRKLVKKTIQILIPQLYREVFKNNPRCLEAALRCEVEGTEQAAEATAEAARAAGAEGAAWAGAARAARAAGAAWAGAASAAEASAEAARAVWAVSAASARVVWAAAHSQDHYLILSAQLCFEVLDEMNSPGAVWIRKNKWMGAEKLGIQQP